MTVVESSHELGSNRGKVLRSLRSAPLGMLGLGMLVTMAALALLAPVLARTRRPRCISKHRFSSR